MMLKRINFFFNNLGRTNLTNSYTVTGQECSIDGCSDSLKR